MSPKTIVTLLTEHNDYPTGSPEWHCIIDLSISVFEKTGNCSLERVIREHDQNLEYYATYLPVLELAGYIKLEHK